MLIVPFSALFIMIGMTVHVRPLANSQEVLIFDRSILYAQDLARLTINEAPGFNLIRRLYLLLPDDCREIYKAL